MIFIKLCQHIGVKKSDIYLANNFKRIAKRISTCGEDASIPVRRFVKTRGDVIGSDGAHWQMPLKVVSTLE